MNWDEIQQRRNKWVAHNFPENVGGPGIESAMGIVEEMGELAHCHLKEWQKIRGNEDLVAGARDAIGDLMVYLLGIGTANDVPMDYCRTRADRGTWPERTEGGTSHYALLATAEAVGELAKGQASSGLSRTNEHHITRVIAWAKRYCEFREWNLDEILEETWNHVEQRDWIAYPDTGFPPKENSL